MFNIACSAPDPTKGPPDGRARGDYFYVQKITGQVTWDTPAEFGGAMILDKALAFKKKRYRLFQCLHKDDAPGYANATFRLTIRRPYLYDDSFTQLYWNTYQYPEVLRPRAKVEFDGEEGIDAGGLSKEWFLELSQKLVEPVRGLFRECAVKAKDDDDDRGGGGAGSGDGDGAPGGGGDGEALFYVLHEVTVESAAAAGLSEGDLEARLQQFEFAGVFFGKALLDRQLVDVRLADWFWFAVGLAWRRQRRQHGSPVSKLPGGGGGGGDSGSSDDEEIDAFGIEDLERHGFYDATLLKSLAWMRDNEVENIIFEDFSVMLHVSPDGCVAAEAPGRLGGLQTTIDLIPNGRDVDVDDANKGEYLKRMLRYRLRQAVTGNLALDRFVRGLAVVVDPGLVAPAAAGGAGVGAPGEAALTLSAADMRLLLSGRETIDVALVAQHVTLQGGFTQESRVVRWFWDTLEAFGEKERACVLQFATGSSRLPADGLDPPLNLTKMALDSVVEHTPTGSDGWPLPKAHTCFNQLVLPEYPTLDMLGEKLLFAAKNTEGFLLG